MASQVEPDTAVRFHKEGHNGLPHQEVPAAVMQEDRGVLVAALIADDECHPMDGDPLLSHAPLVCG